MMETFAQKMAHVARVAGYVQKDAVNSFHKYRYASADAVLSGVRESMAEAGLFVAFADSEVTESRVETDPKGRTVHTVTIKKTLTVSDGTSNAQGIGHGCGQDSGDKAVMKAETAAMKYAVAALFLVSWGEDPEADEKTDKRAAPTQAKPKGGTPPADPFQQLWGAMTDYVNHKDKDKLSAFFELWLEHNKDADPKRLEAAKAQVAKVLGA